MKTSTHDFLTGIPAPVVPLVSHRVMGGALDRGALADRLSDPDYLAQVVGHLEGQLKELLLDLYEAGGIIMIESLAQARNENLDVLRSRMEELGRLGLVYQGGLSPREPLILLPSFELVMDSLRMAHVRDARDLAWRAQEREGLWPHITVVNALSTLRIRCKSGMELFKRGKEQLDAMLSHVMDTARIYDELVELGCLAEKDGYVVPVPRAVVALAMEGETRYGIWRFMRSCRFCPGLDYRVFTALGELAMEREYFSRIIRLYVQSKQQPEARCDRALDALVDEWIDVGVLEQDVTERWVRFSPRVYAALKTGRIEGAPQPCSEEVIVQPTMEILVPKDFDPVDLINVGEMADLVQADVVSVYRITKGSIFRALQAGWNEAKLASFLERISRHSLPDAVRVNAAGWCRLHSEAVIIRGTFLVYSGERSLLPRGLEEVLPGIYRVPRFSDDQITSFLAKRGVMVKDTDEERDAAQEINWGRPIPLAPPKPAAATRIVMKEGVYPYGMVAPVPFGPMREMFFEEALRQGRELVVFYPRQGYGELQVRRVTPIAVFRRGGMPFMEAYCEDTKEGEVFDLTKVRAVLRD